MSLFKKKEKKEGSCCCCGGGCNEESKAKVEDAKGEGARIKILGSGCAKCQSLEDATRESLIEMGLEIEIAHVTDFSEIAAYGVMTTPALVLDDKVVSFGKVLKKNEIKKLLGKLL